MVAEAAPPYRGLELSGEAILLRDDLKATLERVAVRYLGEATGRRYAESASSDIVIRLEPGHVRAWDFSDTQI